MDDINELVLCILDCCKNIRQQLGPGYLESVYKNAMIIELRKHQLKYEIEKPIQVFYNGHIVGSFKADIIVENKLILELKATNGLTVANEVQLVNYLTSTGIDDGLLINFGCDKLQVKRKFRVYRKK